MIIETKDTYEIDTDALVVASFRSGTSSAELKLTSPTTAWTITIEGTFAVRRDNNEVNPAELSALVGESVITLRARKSDGQLDVEFTHGWLLTVSPDDQYEAWQMSSSSGERLIAVPGNGVAIWRATP
jgi:Family of unknown function (DUF6188)